MERDDIASGMSYSNDRIYAMRKIVDARYESQNDYWAYSSIS